MVSFEFAQPQERFQRAVCQSLAHPWMLREWPALGGPFLQPERERERETRERVFTLAVPYSPLVLIAVI